MLPKQPCYQLRYTEIGASCTTRTRNTILAMSPNTLLRGAHVCGARSQIQLTSHDLPQSGENDCSMRAVVCVGCVQT